VKVLYAADSTLGLSPERARALGIEVVPVTVTIGEQTLKDYVEADPRVILDALARGERVTTSGPSPETLAHRFESWLGSHDRVVLATVSSELSVTYSTARLAARPFGKRVAVLDSRSLNAGLRFTLERARYELARGTPFETLAQAVAPFTARIGGWILPGSLTALYRSGRIGGLTRMIGGILSLLPLIELKEGRLAAAGRVRGWRSGVRRIVRLARAMQPSRVVLAHAEHPKAVEALKAQLASAGVRVDPIVHDAGAAVTVHGGAGSIGVLVLP